MPARKWDGISIGIGLTVLSVLIFGIQDATAKVLVQTWSPFQIAMMRYWAFGLFSLVMVSRQAPLRHAFRSRTPVLQVMRGLVLTCQIWLFSLAVRTVPLGELQSIIQLAPLVVTLLAIPLLGERVGTWRIGAVVVGFVGALIILRPGGLPFTFDVAYACVAVLTLSTYTVLTRKVATVDSTATNMVYVGVVGMVLTTGVGIWFWTPMNWQGVLLVAVIMVTTVTGHGVMMASLKSAPASVVQPFNYIALPWAAFLSLVVFGHLIDTVSLVGAAIIVGSGLVVWARERRAQSIAAKKEAKTVNEE